MEIKRRFLRPPTRSFFLFGPRGSGKSTWLKQQYPAAATIDLLDPETQRQYAAAPERLRAFVEGHPNAQTVVVDEIQKVPEVLDVVHQLMEETRARRFILTGSSARKLKRSGVDLLGGRALLKTMHPFLAAEMGESFSLERALHEGLLPLVVGAERPSEVLRSYAALYVREEVQSEGLVRRVGQFARFLEAASFSHAAALNAAQVARECQVERKTVEHYLEILEDLLLAFRVPVFTKRAKRRLTSHSKFYYFDAGVFRSLRPAGPLDTPEEIGGAALEGVVAQHLRAWSAYRDDPPGMFFWRTKAGLEVDFIVYGKDVFAAIEVKNTARLRPRDLGGLRAFGEDYPSATRLLLYRGRERLKLHGILCLPCEAFLKRLIPSHPLPS